MITHTRGFEFRRSVGNDVTKMIVMNNMYKYVIDTIETISGDTYLVCNDTKDWKVGLYSYQTSTLSGIAEIGDMQILENFALDDAKIKSHWEEVLDAIDAQIAGKASVAQQHITVGDKTIAYCSLQELLNLREFVTIKVEEEKTGQTQSGNQKKILYVWR